MRKLLMALISIAFVLSVASAQAESATGASSGAQSEQIFQCQQKVKQLSEQVRPLQSKLSALRTERKGVSSSGGEVARFKLANLDQEISQTLKQLDGVNGQIDNENRRCDELAHKTSTPPAQTATPTQPQRGKRKP